MKTKFQNFMASDEGAVTVDWVVLTAAIVALAVGVMLTIKGSSDDVGSGTGTYLTNVTAGGV